MSICRSLAGVSRSRWFVAAFISTAMCLAARADWPALRGPTADGHASQPGTGDSPGLPLKWSETENVRWKTEIPLRGWSTPAILGKQIWLTTAPPDGHEFYVSCVDADSGAVKLNRKLFECEKPEPLGNNMNSYATPSPALEPDRVYIHFGSYGTACLDTDTQKVLWQRTDLKCRHYRGPASSPVIFQDLLILTFDGVDLQYVIAVDKKTGKTVWKTDRSVAWNDENVPGQMARDGDLRKAHSTPVIVKTPDHLLMLTGGAKAGYGYDPQSGKELWRVRYDAWSAASMPLYQDGVAFFISGYGGKTELLALKADGQGDVTDTHVLWRVDKSVSKTASPLLVNGLLYMVSDEGAVTCLDSKDGSQIWRERIPGNYAASPLYADGRIYFCNQQGKTSVLKAGRQFEILASNTLDNGLMASPAIAGKALFLRTKTHLYKIEEGK